MSKNESGYELHVGPDGAGRYFTVPPGEDYDPPEAAELPEIEPAGEPEHTPPAAASDRGGVDQNTAPAPAPRPPTGQPVSVDQIDTPSAPPAAASDRGGVDQNVEK